MIPENVLVCYVHLVYWIYTTFSVLFFFFLFSYNFIPCWDFWVKVLFVLAKSLFKESKMCSFYIVWGLHLSFFFFFCYNKMKCNPKMEYKYAENTVSNHTLLAGLNWYISYTLLCKNLIATLSSGFEVYSIGQVLLHTVNLKFILNALTVAVLQ